MKYLVWSLVILLVVMHQDYWQWHDATLLFGFYPRTLAYHSFISVMAAVVWWLATLYCWPHELIQSAETEDVELGKSK